MVSLVVRASEKRDQEKHREKIMVREKKHREKIFDRDREEFEHVHVVSFHFHIKFEHVHVVSFQFKR